MSSSWPERESRLLTFEAQDRRTTLRVDAPSLLPLARRLHSCARVSIAPCAPSEEADLAWLEEAGRRFAVRLFGQPWETGMEADTVFFQSENLVTQIFSERHADKLQLHAGAVKAPDGKGWLIAGESGSGKTSLTLALTLAGWKWLSDELILVERTKPGEMAGVRRNFNIKEVSFPRFPETAGLPDAIEILSPKRGCLVRFIDPETLRPNRSVPCAALSGILFPKHVLGLPEPCLKPLVGAELSGRLAASVNRGPDWTMEWIIRTAGTVPAWELACEDPRSAARLIVASLGGTGTLQN